MDNISKWFEHPGYKHRKPQDFYAAVFVYVVFVHVNSLYNVGLGWIWKDRLFPVIALVVVFNILCSLLAYTGIEYVRRNFGDSLYNNTRIKIGEAAFDAFRGMFIVGILVQSFLVNFAAAEYFDLNPRLNVMSIFISKELSFIAPAAMLLFIGLLAIQIGSSVLLILGIARSLMIKRGLTVTEKPPRIYRGKCDLLVMSDLHITADNEKTIEGDLEDFSVFGFIDKIIDETAPSALVISGDVTDVGSPSAWGKVSGYFKKKKLPAYIVPGNHDIHYFSVDRVKKYNAKEDLIKVMVDSDITLGLQSEKVSYTEAEVLENISHVSEEMGGCRKFPALVVNRQLNIRLLLLNSNRRDSNSPITGAVGFVGNRQLKEAAKLLESNEIQGGLIIVLHHHILPPAGSDVLEKFCQCIDSGKVLKFAFKYKADAIIHGHTHIPIEYVARKGADSIRVISCGSSLYNAKGPFASTIIGPSCMGLNVVDGRIADVFLVR